MAKGEKRDYVILSRDTESGQYRIVGQVSASGHAAAIRVADKEFELEEGIAVAVTARSWYEVPIAAKQERQLEIGERLEMAKA